MTGCKHIVRAFIYVGLISNLTTIHSSDRYFFCGTDEDGCLATMHQYCVCIPYDDIAANERYCLDLDELKCAPLSKNPNCNPAYIYENQGECLATIFQSEPTPPCTVTTQTFCLKESMGICDPSGQPNSCMFPQVEPNGPTF